MSGVVVLREQKPRACCRLQRGRYSSRPITAHWVSITTASRGDMAADVVHTLCNWHVHPQVLQSQTLHLFVDLDGRREFHLLRRLVQETIHLRLHLGVY